MIVTRIARLVGLALLALGCAQWSTRPEFEYLPLSQHGETFSARFAPTSQATFAMFTSRTLSDGFILISGNFELIKIDGKRQVLFQLNSTNGSLFVEFDVGNSSLLRLISKDTNENLTVLPLGNIRNSGEFGLSLLLQNQSVTWFGTGSLRTPGTGQDIMGFPYFPFGSSSIQLNHGVGASFTDSITEISVSSGFDSDNGISMFNAQWQQYLDNLPSDSHNILLYVGALASLGSGVLKRPRRYAENLVSSMHFMS